MSQQIDVAASEEKATFDTAVESANKTKEFMRNSGKSELRSPTTSSNFLDIGGSVYVAEVNHTDIGQACAGAIGPPQITDHILVVPDQVFGFALHPHDRHRQRPDDPS